MHGKRLGHLTTECEDLLANSSDLNGEASSFNVSRRKACDRGKRRRPHQLKGRLLALFQRGCGEVVAIVECSSVAPRFRFRPQVVAFQARLESSSTELCKA